MRQAARAAATRIHRRLETSTEVPAPQDIRSHFQDKPHIHWRQLVVAVEILGLFICIFIPCGKLDLLVNIIIGFVCSMQVEAFRKFHDNPYATTMCTGNLRSASFHLYQSLHFSKGTSLKLALQYFLIILLFDVGIGGYMYYLIDLY